MTISGSVKSIDRERNAVDIEIHGVNQLDELVCDGSATAILPRRNGQ